MYEIWQMGSAHIPNYKHVDNHLNLEVKSLELNFTTDINLFPGSRGKLCIIKGKGQNHFQSILGRVF